MRREFVPLLIVVGILTVLTWGLSLFVVPNLSSAVRGALVLFFLALAGVLATLAGFKDALELFDRWRKPAGQQDQERPRAAERGGAEAPPDGGDPVGGREAGADPMPPAPKPAQLRELIRIKERRLFQLQKRRALQGINTDPAVIIEIEEIERELTEEASRVAGGSKG